MNVPLLSDVDNVVPEYHSLYIRNFHSSIDAYWRTTEIRENNATY